MRESGILMPVSSLPGPYGIGCFGKEAFKFVDFLAQAAINSFLKIYNKTKGYSLIISNSGFDNLLYADKAFDITQEIVDGLNARYTPNLKK